MELLAPSNPIKKPPRSDERDGDLFCGTYDFSKLTTIEMYASRVSTLTKPVEIGKHYMIITTRVDYPQTITVNSGGTLIFEQRCNWATSADGNPTIGIIEATATSITMTFSAGVRYMWFAFND